MPAGSHLGPYELVELVGAGGMGEVYRARDPRLGREVALKVVPSELAADPERRERFLREARMVSALNHPNICTIHEIGSAGGLDYICFEYIEGPTLATLLEGAVLSFERFLELATPLAEALAYAHGKGILHRDLKPANIMVSERGPKILDFGLAKITAPAGESPRDPTLTDAGLVMGTAAYMSPEQALGQKVDERSDIFSLGAVLYEMASGKRAFPGSVPTEVIDAVLHHQPAPLTGLRPELPAELSLVVEKALRKDVTERYPHTAYLAADLRRLGEPGAPRLIAGGRRKGVSPRRRLVLLAAVGATVLALAAAMAIRFAAAPTEIESVAVLPFVNVGGDPNTEYASDGITESVIGRLSQLPRMRVIAFSSVARYKGPNVDLQALARDLKVGALVVGRLVPQADRFTISAELVSTRDRSRMWGEQYDTKKTDILAVQQDIASRIADRLRGRLSETEERRVKKRYTENGAAYEAYLKGHYYHNKFTPESLEKSLEYFQQAIDKDPAYALAYTGIAATYGTMAYQGQLPPKEAMAKAEPPARRALELDDELAEAHATMATLTKLKQDWAGTEREYRRAIDLNPGLAWVHRFFALFLRQERRWDEAIEQGRQARDLDPLSLETNKALGMTYYWAGRYDEAIELYRKTLEIDPNFSDAHEYLSDAYARKGMYREAIEEKRKSLTLSGDEEAAAVFGEDRTEAAYRSGIRTLAEAQLEALKHQSQQEYVSPISFAYLYAILEDKEHAIEWLRTADEEGSPWLHFLAADPTFDGLRSDPRFAELVRRRHLRISKT